ncbi:CrcB family protein [Saccharomonospora xinjiangensis]|uniref:fluoride efflux transporter FluC n=1 Tax=Saccharomonospora xinjiangensis TaxID=75294 RepID=UPI00106F3FA2|nr:CrcB family protein [Saccharomonospora xinjiangensis]QBQ61025.1 camphor resistance protein CrcB [Saccharomonospora xinjiangensis]
MAAVVAGYRRDVLLAIAAGGALGSLARYGMAELFAHPPGEFAVSTLLTNVLGSLGLGTLMAFVEHGRLPLLLRPFLGIGFFGGFTTMSAFALDTVEAVRQGNAGMAVAYVAGSLAASFVAVAAGFVGTGKRLRRAGRGGRS